MFGLHTQLHELALLDMVQAIRDCSDGHMAKLTLGRLSYASYGRGMDYLRKNNVRVGALVPFIDDA